MNSVAGSIRKYLPFFKKRKAFKVLDYGAGTLRNTKYLSNHGFNVFAADLPEKLSQVKQWALDTLPASLLEVDALHESRLNVDLVISTFVLNIIPDLKERHTYLKNISLNLRPGGYLLLEVKCRERLKHTTCQNSSLANCLHCDKSFSLEELDQLTAAFGFRRLGFFYGRYSLGVLYKYTKAPASEKQAS